ncbi:gibberellin-regulated protein 6-like isoform X2 [Mangifera indica]|uniref:gibberellin-regulated protein 6-like isoform X2 n=1 Tax=Mangifera indica TaxID=29780 RepID=UPI001CFBC5F8|nr:gibberellin-regulated protein 6-like isoform X2 [Mangifera indica]
MARLVLFVVLAVALGISMVMAKERTQYHRDSTNGFGAGSVRSYECPNECTRRCSKTQYHKTCMFMCQKCCAKCLCVPPGYHGNKDVCPCYNNLKTRRGGPKCP